MNDYSEIINHLEEIPNNMQLLENLNQYWLQAANYDFKMSEGYSDETLRLRNLIEAIKKLSVQPENKNYIAQVWVQLQEVLVKIEEKKIPNVNIPPICKAGDELNIEIGNILPGQYKKIKGIDNYGLDQKSQERINNVLKTPEGADENYRTPLYEGLEEYEKNHNNLVEKYKASNPKILLEISVNDPCYFRKTFAAYLERIENNPHYPKYSEAAGDTLEAFLTKEGAKLYQLALEEERYSKAYIDAVLAKSSKEYIGSQWAERPVALIGGPSAAGKTVASDETMDKIIPTLATKGNDANHKNYVVKVDGGDIREVSQIRKLLVKAACNKGYPIISDLHKKSNVLEGLKTNIQEFALQKKCPHGVSIPLTFSTLLIPGGMKRLLLKLAMLGNAKVGFCQVVGIDKQKFQETVQYQGESRATNTDPNAKYDLNEINNSKNLPEFKIYESQHFDTGVKNSKLAEKIFSFLANGNYLSFRVINDRVLKKYDSNKKIWLDASNKDEDENLIIVSQRVFNNWEKSDKQIGLQEFMSKKENKVPILIEFTQGEKLNDKESSEAKESIKEKSPAVEKLSKLCDGKRALYFEILMDQIENNQDDWYNQLSNACKIINDFRDSHSRLYAGLHTKTREDLGDFLERLGPAGYLFNNSKVIDSNKKITPNGNAIIDAILALKKEIDVANPHLAASASNKQQEPRTQSGYSSYASISRHSDAQPSKSSSEIKASITSPAILALSKLCDGKRAIYLEKFIEQVEFNEPNWYQQLTSACKLIESLEKHSAKYSRDELDNFLESCGPVGKLFNNSKVIDSHNKIIIPNGKAIVDAIFKFKKEVDAANPHLTVKALDKASETQVTRRRAHAVVNARPESKNQETLEKPVSISSSRPRRGL